METKREFLESIRNMNPNYDMDLISRAYDVAEKMHAGQLRKSGDPYIIHPMACAKTLAELGLDEATVAAGLLHDVVEDTEYTKEQMTEEFGEEIALLVDGVTKLSSLVAANKEIRQAESLRKMFLAMSKDIRVLVIKLADRLHNLRTIQYMAPEKQKEVCRETLDIYAPLASRLGIFAIKFELEDISFKYLYPEEYKDISTRLEAWKGEHKDTLENVIKEITDALNDAGLKFEIYGRTKHYYSIFRKMQFQKKELEEIFDLMAVRVIVESIKDCYAVLGIVHTMWTPIPGRFKDYIAMPKPNMYQSLHTTVMGEEGRPFEVQIRTYEMHRIAEYGIAAHWKYKEGVSKDQEEVKLAWLRQALEWQADTKDPKEFMETLKVDLFATQVFVFTPAGDVMELPAGATPLDFAFKIHTDVGLKCIGAKVNGKMVTIDHKLENGDIVEILTNPNSSGPSIDWLNIAKSSGAKTKIRQFLKKQQNTDNVDKGKEALEKYIRKQGYEPKEILRNAYLRQAVEFFNFRNIDELYTQVANGGTFTNRVGRMLIGFYDRENEDQKKKEENTAEVLLGDSPEKTRAKTERRRKQQKNRPGVIVKGMDNMLVRMAHCCNPVPGDDIIGFITKGRGVSVHRKDCVNILSMPEENKERFIEVEWADMGGVEYDAGITILCDDRKGLFSDISRVCEAMDVRITGVNTRIGENRVATIWLTVSITSIDQIDKLMLNIKGIPSVLEVFRSHAV
ncbi:MAG: bifunctional (p)ppGpp synthetase/guanosine-3',5'-bis(diphosphate) 3'-pyrophosphohydrolase [Anaerovoracaceae bacterium]|nr:bifunctional (p)ppGpp synthetase/guanosine-3',5'-bis(diphosphate) 3'-pyrophosphohydrolase [Anaerovoracaceae bacterium]